MDRALITVALLLVVVASTAGIVAATREPRPVCVEGHTVRSVDYPFIGMRALGPEYTAMAMLPVTQDHVVCTRWEVR